MTNWEPSSSLIPFSFTQLMKEKANIALSLEELRIWGRNESAGMEDKGRTGFRRPGHGAEDMGV